MQTVTLFIADDRNRQLLAEWLGEAYDVSTPSEPRVGVGTDLVLVDDTSFPQLKSGLQTWKDDAEPVFAPVLLVTDQPQSESFDPSDWETIDGLYVVDDIVSAPIKKAVLYRRLENLLERRELSQQLASQYRRSEQRFERLFEDIPDPVFVCGDDGRLTAANEAFRSLTGLDTASSVALADIEAVPPPAVADIEAAIEAARADGESVDTPTVRLRGPDGGERYVAVSVAPLAGEEVVVVLRDLTERRERERELERTETRFQQIAEHVSEVIWLADASGDPLYVSPGYEALTGRSADSLAGESRAAALEHVHPADAERLEAHLETLFSDVEAGTAAEAYGIEYRLIDGDGATRWVESDIYPVRDADGTVTRLVGILDDVTDRKERERRFSAIFNQTFHLTALTDPDGTVVEINDRALDFFDLPREAVLDTELDQVGDESVAQEARQRLRTRIDEAADGTLVRYEETFPQGEEAVTMDVSIKPITDSLESVVLLVVEARDVTERKRREEELARQNERLEQFASVLSHDLRNPLQVVRARIDLAASTGDHDHLEEAERAVGRMDRLIEDILDLARQGSLDVEARRVSLSTIAQRAWMAVSADAATLDVTDAAVRADPDHLTQLFENLFRNAVEHGGSDVTVSVAPTDAGFAVADDGPGIPADRRESVFDLGHTSETEGTGFGLAIVDQIADGHGWSVTVGESESGGARFAFAGVDRLD